MGKAATGGRESVRIIITTTWNSARIIEAFLDHHRALGFDLVMVMDFGSTDGTLDVLRSKTYTGFVELVAFPGIADLDSSNIMLAMAKARNHGDSLCLFCDPDEFLVLGSGRTLADLDLADASALVLNRFNVTGLRSEALADPDSIHPLGCLNLKIVTRRNPEDFEKESGDLRSPYIFTYIWPKVLVKLADTIAIGVGDHRADFVGDAHRLVERSHAYLLHYPFSTFDALKRKLDLSRLDFAANPTLPPSYGWHVRRWIRLDDADRLREEYASHFIADADLPMLLSSGMVEIDDSVREARRDASSWPASSDQHRRPA